MANVFPEKMDRVDTSDVSGSLKQIEGYLRYMCERTEFAVTTVTRQAAKAGNIGAEVVNQVQELKSDLSITQSQLARLSGTVTALQAEVVSLRPLTGADAPTTSTSGSVGQIYIATSAPAAYICVAVVGNPQTYTWVQIS